MHQQSFTIKTRGRGITDVTGEVAGIVDAARASNGLCSVFIHHTSAALMLCENADPQVLRDLEVFMSRLVPDGDPMFGHTAEGPDDMPAHVRSVLTHSDLTLPVTDGRLALGTWQGVYVWEHRAQGHRRRMTVTLTP